MTLRKHTMKGISFHHRSNKKSIKQTYKLQDFFNLDELYLQIKKETPAYFTNTDIKRLLGDHGRNEINSQISRCVDFISKWRGILATIERCFPSSFDNQIFLGNSPFGDEISLGNLNLGNSPLGDEVEIYLTIKKLIGLWKHNLNILEMTAEAQYFINRPLN